MANRRMISIGIINSAKFLKMPISSRLLYYDLCLRADDDGVVEGFNTLRMTGASEDDLRVLSAKNYIKILNEDLVSYITNWTEHNKIRADRKVDSIYKDLLLQVLPDTKLLESKPRADRNKNRVDNGTSHCLTDGCQMSAEDRLGKVSIGKDSIGKDRTEEDIPPLPLSFPTSTHEIIFNQFGNLTYKTWFEDSIIEAEGDLIIIKVKEMFKKEIIQDRFLDVIKTLTSSNVTVKVSD